MQNWNHDLVHQLSEDLDSLWRYEDYLKNSEGCDHCSGMWRKLKEMDEEKVEILRQEIERHVNEKRFD